MHALALALTLVLRTYDMVGMPPSELARAERAAADVLARAQIELSWIDCRALAEGGDRRCEGAPRHDELLVRIVAAPQHPASNALADSYVDARSGSGALATVYVDRVRSLAAAGGVDPGTLMGRAVAHEVGHLLSGSAAHSAHGVMRAVWTAPALRGDSPRAWRFSTVEAERLRQHLSDRGLDARTTLTVAEPMPPTTPPCARNVATCGQRR